MSNHLYLIYQNAEVSLNFDRQTLRGTTRLWIIHSDRDTLGPYINLHCRQCIIDHITVNGEECNFTHNDPLKTLTYGSTVPTYNGEQLDINYRAALEINRDGELQIELPDDIYTSTTSLDPLPRRTPKEVTSRFEHLAKIQHDMQENPDSRSVLMVVTIRYHLNMNLKDWGGWSFSFKQASKSDGDKVPVVTNCVTNHSSDFPLCDVDGIRTWLPCLDDPSQQAIFDISLTVPTYSACSDSDHLERYRVVCSGIHVSTAHSHPVKQSGTGTSSTSSNMDAIAISSSTSTYRFITPHRVPVYAIGAFVGLIQETFTVPLYLSQGHIWVTDELAAAVIQKSDTSASDRTSNIEKSVSGLVSKIQHTFFGFDAAVRHLHKAISRRFGYSRCYIVFVPDMDCNYMSFDGFLCLSYRWMHNDSCIYMEMPSHLNLLQAYLYTWFKGSVHLDSYKSEFILHGAVGFMIDEYVSYVFGADEARYRFYKHLTNVINYEKTSNAFPLSPPFPEDYNRLGEFYSRYLQYKSTVIFHIICHRIGGNVDVVLKAIRNIVKTKAPHRYVAGHSSSVDGGPMPPPLMAPPTPQNFGIPVPGTPSNAPLTPMQSPSPVVGVSYMTSPLWSGDSQNNPSKATAMPSTSQLLGRNRSDSISSTGDGCEHSDLSASWKIDPSELAATSATQKNSFGHSPAQQGAEISTTSNDELAVPFSLPPPPPLIRRASSCSSTGTDNVSFEESLWGVDYSGAKSNAGAFLSDVREMSGGAGSDLNDAFLDQFVHHPGCMFLRAGVGVDPKHRKVDIALHQVGFRSGEVDSLRFAYKEKIPINVVEQEVWQYSRRVDGHAQLFSLNLHSKPRRQGGRRRSTADEGSSTPTTVFDAISLEDETSDSTKLGGKYMCTPADIQGGRVQAQAIAALRSGLGGPIAQSVQFVAVDPDVCWIREIHLSAPDCLLIEQLYMDMDVVGQIQALKALSKAHLTHQAIPAQLLRLRAMKDVLLNGWNEMNVTHSLCVRTEAAYALAQWQCNHAPSAPPSNGSTTESSGSSVTRGRIGEEYEWAGMELLLGALRGMFTELVEITVPTPADSTAPPRTEKVLIPLPNDLADHTKTQLRSALLVALSTIKDRNGETPGEVVTELLNFAENNDNSPHSSSDDGNGETSSGSGARSYDDSHYSATLLLCLSKVSVRPSSPGAAATLRRIIAIAQHFLHRERIMSVCLYDDNTDRAKGIYTQLSGDRSRSHDDAPTPPSGGGIVTAMALQCICNAEIQLDTSNVGQKSDSDSACMFNYKFYVTYGAATTRVSPHTTPLIRASALDCCLRLAFAKYNARTLTQTPANQTSQGEMPNPSRIANNTTMIVSESLSLVLSVVSRDPSRYVRRSAALSLLFALQDRAGFIPHSIVSLYEPLNTLNWSDPSGLVVISTHDLCRKRYSANVRNAFLKAPPSARQIIEKWWTFITCDPSVVHDQMVRSTLLSCWLYTFYSRRHGVQRVPKCLAVAPATDSSKNSNDSSTMPDLSFRDKFTTLIAMLPSGAAVRDPVESCCSLEEAFRVGRYGRQLLNSNKPNTSVKEDDAGNGISAGVLRLSRRASIDGTSTFNEMGTKRERTGEVGHHATKRPRVVKFIM
mmetsp:Transcript_7413/g.11017  ORF Transcript_7413/g.11017 Transcript_7413/m.11017 type:complete len:1611 (+) Transcript_7413:76-4908(+)